jgi:hypothetical protein
MGVQPDAALPFVLEPVIGERRENLGADSLIGEGARRGISVDLAHDRNRERDDVRRREPFAVCGATALFRELAVAARTLRIRHRDAADAMAADVIS